MTTRNNTASANEQPVAELILMADDKLQAEIYESFTQGQITYSQFENAMKKFKSWQELTKDLLHIQESETHEEN